MTNMEDDSITIEIESQEQSIAPQQTEDIEEVFM
jgi:hypothetical protein